MWDAVRKALPECEFPVWGHSNERFNGANALDKDLPDAYHRCACVWHVKAFDGWGHSLLQAIACGRVAIVPKGFYRYRAANRYLIPGLTCFEISNVEEGVAAVREVVDNVGRANVYATRCWKAAGDLMRMDFDANADRIGRWLTEVL
jgi:hypothetical protein